MSLNQGAAEKEETLVKGNGRIANKPGHLHLRNGMLQVPGRRFKTWNLKHFPKSSRSGRCGGGQQTVSSPVAQDLLYISTSLAVRDLLDKFDHVQIAPFFQPAVDT